MNDQTYQKPTKVYKDQFYDLLHNETISNIRKSSQQNQQETYV